ncbi:MAG: DUF2231 domain-containing protein [Myxococcota bacterium]
MDELHPAVVHLPIGAVLLYPWFELARSLTGQRILSLAALAVLAVALLGSMVASATGEAAYEAAVETGFSHELLGGHEEYAEMLPWALIVVLGVRLVLERRWGPSPRAGWLGFGLGLVLTGYVTWVGYTGGTLVYEHGVGVQGVVPEP